MKNIAVILAGGSGTRLETELPKQFLKIAGKLVIEHTIDAFEKNENISKIFVISNPSYTERVHEIVNKANFTKVTKILNGGAERYHSSLSAINAINEECNIIFHDAVRPLVNNRIINDCISNLKKYKAIDVCIKSSDTIVNVKDSIIDHIPDRRRMYQGQTPQAFKLSTIKEAYNLALQDPNFKTTDDCGVVRKYLPNIDIKVVEGEVFNIKLTYKEDLALLEKLFQIKTLNRQKREDFSELRNKKIVIFGSSYGIGKSIKDICENNGAIVYGFSRTENQIDVSKYENVKKALEAVYGKESRIDYIINCAGVLHKQTIENISYTDINESIAINLNGAINVTKESIKYLKKSRGKILLFTSSSYTRGRSFYALYSSLKASIVNLTQALCEEWDQYGVEINCICPHRTNTPMRTENFGIEPEESLLQPEEVAIESINILLNNISGQVIEIKK
jgi:2-C-methyl-D-erythritol 4-phosphate cytidylyltransferase